jgi:hypothetical protein
MHEVRPLWEKSAIMWLENFDWLSSSTVMNLLFIKKSPVWIGARNVFETYLKQECRLKYLKTTEFYMCYVLFTNYFVKLINKIVNN